MLNSIKEKTVPVPRRGKVLLIMAMGLLAAASTAAGFITAPEEGDIPVILSNGEVITPPWYITVDGENVALVESQEAAQDVLENILDEYGSGDGSVLDIEIKEQTSAEKMDIKSGDKPPEILTAAEAEELLLEGEDGNSYLTVVTTEVQKEKESIGFTQEYRADPDMYAGEKKIAVEGREGTREVTKKIVRENGRQVEEEIVEEDVLQEPQEEIVLTGTGIPDGCGGGSGCADEGVSYDPDAVYELLKTPVDQVYVSSNFGQRWGRLHRGVDLALAQSSAIYAADDGKVYFSGCCGSYGNLVKIDHGNGMQTYYAHCSELLVSEGTQVERGDKIALVGSTGNSTGPHLHFEVIINGNLANPADFLDF